MYLIEVFKDTKLNNNLLQAWQKLMFFRVIFFSKFSSILQKKFFFFYYYFKCIQLNHSIILHLNQSSEDSFCCVSADSLIRLNIWPSQNLVMRKQALKFDFPPLISLLLQTLTWPYSVNIKDIKVQFPQNVLYRMNRDVFCFCFCRNKQITNKWF